MIIALNLILMQRNSREKLKDAKFSHNRLLQKDGSARNLLDICYFKKQNKKPIFFVLDNVKFSCIHHLRKIVAKIGKYQRKIYSYCHNYVNNLWSPTFQQHLIFSSYKSHLATNVIFFLLLLHPYPYFLPSSSP